MDYQKKTFERYISTQLLAVNRYSFQRDYALFEKYYRRNYLPLLPAGREARILDVGCGLGRFLNFLNVNGYKNYLGIDTSTEAVEQCRERGLNAERADAIEHISQNPATYDAIVMNDVIEHLPKPRMFDLVAATYEALKPGGILIVKTPNAANPLMGAHSLAMDVTHEIVFSEESLSQLLKIFEFCEVRVLSPNLYVQTHNPLHWIARLATGCLNCVWRILYALYGRPGTRIFAKHLLAVGRKPE